MEPTPPAPEDVRPPEGPQILGIPSSAPEVALRAWKPRLLPRFELTRVLGQGGMGSVFLATDTKLDRQVAIKVVNNTLGQTAKRLERFRREGEITAGLDHPGIVRVFSAGVIDELPYLAYEYVEDADTLRETLAPLDRPARVAKIRDVARALGHAHEHGVVHRDVKPENVLTSSDGSVRVADFGLALAQGLERITSTGAVLGTPTYLAPEQASGRIHQIGPPTDVWALGVMLYEALTNALPFGGRTLAELIVRVCKGQYDPPSSRDGTIPPGLEAIVLRALAVDPQERYPTATELANDLDAWLSGGEVSAPLRKRPLDARSFALGLAIAGALGVLVIAWVTRPRPAGRAVVQPVETTTALPTPEPGEVQWAHIRGLPPAEQVAPVRAWLKRFSEHPRRPEMAALSKRLRQTQPLLRISLPGTRAVRACWLPDGRSLVLHRQGRSDIATIRSPEGEVLQTHRAGAIYNPTVIPHGLGYLVVASKGRAAYRLLWCPWEGKPSWVSGVPAPGVTNAVAWRPTTTDPNGPLLLALGGARDRRRGWARVMRWQPSNNAVDGIADVHWAYGPVEALAFTPDNEQLLVGGDTDAALGGSIQIVSVATGETAQKWPFTSTGVRALATAPNGVEFALGTKGGQVFLYRLDQQKPFAELAGEANPELPGLLSAHPAIVKGLTYSSDGTQLFSFSNSLRHEDRRLLKVWRLPGHELERVIRFGSDYYGEFHLSPDGEQLLFAGDNGATVWAVR